MNNFDFDAYDYYEDSTKPLESISQKKSVEQPKISGEFDFDAYDTETLKSESSQQQFTLKETAKDVGQQIAAKGAQGFVGNIGNILDTLGLQSKEDLLPGQKEQVKQSFENPMDIGESDILPNYARLPSSKQINQLIKATTGVAEGKTPAGRIAGRGSEFGGEFLSMPGGGIKAAASLIGSGLTGQALREIGVSEGLASTVEIAGAVVPSAVSKKVMPITKEGKAVAEAGRKLGLTEKQITPLVQREAKVSALAKIARKGEKTKEQFASIKESLGNSYDKIKESVSNFGQLSPKNNKVLVDKFMAIRDDLSKTVRASPDKESAIKFIDESIQNLVNRGATPEELINFWQDINKSVKWGAIQGGKKSLTRLKEPILEVLNTVAPKAAKDFEMTNQLYSKYSQVAKKLKPDIIDSFVNKAEMMAIAPVALGLVVGNPWPLAALASESAFRTLTREMLINPYFQNLGNKLVQNFNSSSAKGVKDLVKNAQEFMERKYPKEDWSFLLESSKNNEQK